MLSSKGILRLGIIFIALMQASVVSHEDTHSKICRQYGGTVVEQKVGLLSGSVDCSTTMYTAPEMYASYMLAQANVETMGYAMQVVLPTTFLALLFIKGEDG